MNRRWVRDGRLIFAGTEGHRDTELLKIQEWLADTTKSLAEAAADIASTAATNKQLVGWRKNMDFALEGEIKRAFLNELERRYQDVEVLNELRGIKGPDGKDKYSFDSVFEAKNGNDTSTLYVGEVKQTCEPQDITDSLVKLGKFKKRLADILADNIVEGKKSYNLQNATLKAYVGSEVKLYVGSGNISDEAMEKASNDKVVVVRPGGGRYEVIGMAS
jgi:hypothetical protein